MQLTELSQIKSIVLAGGNASRIDGIDKVMLPLGKNGKPLLIEVIESCPGEVLVAGSPREIQKSVTWVADHEVGGGPGAGIWAALEFVDSEYVFLSAGDQQTSKELVNQICQAAIGNDGAWAIRTDGQGQPLFACVKTQLIKNLLVPSQGKDISPLKLMGQLNLIGVKVNEGQIQDVDTWADATRIVKESSMSEVTPVWLAQVANLLGVSEKAVPVDELLDLTREVAHNVERKSAPLTTFLIGYAAGKNGVTVKELIERVNQAIGDWKPDAK